MSTIVFSPQAFCVKLFKVPGEFQGFWQAWSWCLN
jgi:hypothetical protein